MARARRRRFRRHTTSARAPTVVTGHLWRRPDAYGLQPKCPRAEILKAIYPLPTGTVDLLVVTAEDVADSDSQHVSDMLQQTFKQ